MIIKKRVILITLIFVVAMIAAGVFFLHDDATEQTFKEFHDAVEAGEVESVAISSNITYKKQGDSTTYKTINPASPTLVEYLLLHDVTVKIETDGWEVFSNIFDIASFFIIIGGFFFIARKYVSPSTFKIAKSAARFSDVVGMDNIKNDVLQIIEVMQHSAAYKQKGIRAPKGIILEGDPGNGKTLLARAIAGEARLNFIAAKATDFESMFMAIGPATVKLLFHKARRHRPCIVFIDEFDGIGTKRNYNGSAIETENTRIVTALLNELDGFEQNSGILVIAATNSIKALDPALIRPGRFDARYFVPYPNFAMRTLLIKKYLANKQTAVSIDELAKLFDGFSCSKIESVLNRAALLASQSQRADFTLQNIEQAIKEL